jgi:hypothetical protein
MILVIKCKGTRAAGTLEGLENAEALSSCGRWAVTGGDGTTCSESWQLPRPWQQAVLLGNRASRMTLSYHFPG